MFTQFNLSRGGRGRVGGGGDPPPLSDLKLV